MRGEGFVTKLIRLTNFVNPQEIVRTITPLVTKDGTLIAYPATNSIIITDSVLNIRKIESLIHAMDVAAPEGKGKINVYYLKNANAEETCQAAAGARFAAARSGPGRRGPGHRLHDPGRGRHYHRGQSHQFAHHRGLAG